MSIRTSTLHGILLFLLLWLCSGLLNAQSFNHWTRSFNEESSLLSGAVVGGGAGPSAVYYNPASISEITESKLSFHASLFSLKAYNIKNVLGDDIDLKWTNIQVEPRFLSYMIKPKKHPEWSFEIAMLNNENYHVDLIQSVDERINVLEQLPGEERYYAVFQYQNRFRDDWVGAGWSWKLSNKISMGLSMFVTIKSMEYNLNLDIEAYPVDTAVAGISAQDFYIASYEVAEYIKYNDYRLLWKLGFLYSETRYSFGFCLTSPSVGGIYSDGKSLTRKQKQSNITDPETGKQLPDFLIADFQQKNNVSVDHRTPFSFAAGFTWQSLDKKKALYTTVEYFGGIDPYKLVQANESPNITSGNLSGNMEMNEWLTIMSGAKPVLNGAIGYSWVIGEQLILLAGFRTDFNYVKDIINEAEFDNKFLKGLYSDNYHITSGLSWTILGQNLITGIQYTLGREKNEKQLINLSDPVEYNHVEQAPLQGTRSNTMNILTNSLSLYLGVSVNF